MIIFFNDVMLGFCGAVVVRTIYREREGRNMHRRVGFYIKKDKIK